MSARLPRRIARTLGAAIVALPLCGSLGGCTTLGSQLGWSTNEVSKIPTLHESPPSQLPSPEGLRATSGELRSVPLKWDPLLAGDVAGYAIERATSPDGPWARVAAVSGRLATVHVDGSGAAPVAPDTDGSTSLGDGAILYYRVRAYTHTGQISAGISEVASATTAPLPTAPEDLRAYSHQPRQVPLTWRESADAHVIGYTIDRSPTYRGPFETLARLDGRYETVYVDDELGDLRVFYYRVSARHATEAVGDPSEPVRAVTKPVPLPPVRLRVVDRALGENRLEWDPNVETDLSGYRLLRHRGGDDSPEVVAELGRDELQAEDRSVGADESVAYTVVALDRDGLESAPAEAIEVTSEGYSLVAAARDEGVHLRWNARADEGFAHATIVRRGIFQDAVLGTAENGTFVDTGARPGRTYRYLVVLESAAGLRAPPSQPVEIQVPARQPDASPAS